VFKLQNGLLWLITSMHWAETELFDNWIWSFNYAIQK